GQHGPGRRPGPPRRLRPLPDQRSFAGSGSRPRDRPSLPAGPPGRGNYERGAGRTPVRGVGSGGEPPARAEGDSGGAAGVLASKEGTGRMASLPPALPRWLERAVQVNTTVYVTIPGRDDPYRTRIED